MVVDVFDKGIQKTQPSKEEARQCIICRKDEAEEWVLVVNEAFEILERKDKE